MNLGLSEVIDVRDAAQELPKVQIEGYPLVTSKYLLSYDVDIDMPNTGNKLKN